MNESGEQLLDDVYEAFIANGAYMFNATRLAPSEAEHARRYYDFMRPPSGSTIVDMGCGSGEYGTRLQQLDPTLRVINITNHAKMISYMQASHRECIYTSYEHTTLPDKFADIVMFNESIGYIDLPIILAETARIIKEGGLLVIKDFSITDPTTDRIALDSWGYFIRQPAEFIHAASQAGFSIESLIHPPIYIKHWYDLMENSEAIKHSALQHDPKGLPLCTVLYRFIKGGLTGRADD